MKKLPVWLHLIFGIALALFSIQPWSVKFGAIPLQVFIVYICMFYLCFRYPRYVYGITTELGFKFFLCVLVILSSVLYRTVVDGTGFLRFSQVVTGIVVCIVAGCLVVDEYNRKYFITPLVISCCLSASVAIFQSLGYLNFTWSRTLYYLSSMKVPSGLELYPVSFSYGVIASTVLCLIYSVLLIRNKSLSKDKGYLLIVLFATSLMIIGVVVTESRSGVLGIVLGFLFSVIILAKLKIRYLGFKFISIIVVLFVAIVVNNSDKFMGSDLSTISNDNRISGSWSYFVPVILENPLGISEDKRTGSSSFSRFSGEANVQDALEQNSGYDPHNFIITTMMFYGILAGIALTIIYFLVMFSGLKAIKINRKKKREVDNNLILLIAVMAANLSLIAHSWFHNANLVMGEMRGWLWIGIGLLLAKIVNKSEMKKNVI